MGVGVGGHVMTTKKVFRQLCQPGVQAHPKAQAGRRDPFLSSFTWRGWGGDSPKRMDARKRGPRGPRLKDCLLWQGMVPWGLDHPPCFQSSRLCPSPQAGDSLSQNHQLPER